MWAKKRVFKVCLGGGGDVYRVYVGGWEWEGKGKGRQEGKGKGKEREKNMRGRRRAYD